MKRVIIRNILFLVVALFLSFLIVFSEKLVKKDGVREEIIEEPKSTSLSLVMVGDCLVHGAVYADAQVNGGYDFKPMLEEIKPIVSNFDLAFYNQETILGGTEIGLSTYPRFNSPYEVGDAFIDSGFNLVALANNHTLDRGEQAIINSYNYWTEKGIYKAGSYISQESRDNIEIREENGIKYALLSYTTWTNGLSVPNGKTYLLNRYDENTVKQDIEKVKDKVDLLMVSMHFGDEYSHIPSTEQRKIANYLANLGVDIVIGHHPHVVQPIEFIDDTLVVYSLGNFISAQRGIEKLTGLMVSLNVEKDLKNNTISFNNIEAELLYTYSNYNKGFRSNFKVYPYTKLTDSILSNHEMYYNKYMNIVLNGDTRIQKGDYSGNIK